MSTSVVFTHPGCEMNEEKEQEKKIMGINQREFILLFQFKEMLYIIIPRSISQTLQAMTSGESRWSIKDLHSRFDS